MNPDERALLERTLKVSEENHKMLKALRRAMRLSVMWGFVKILLIVVPLIIGYLYFEPYFGPIRESFQGAQQLINQFK